MTDLPDLAASLRAGWTLPSRWYTDPAVLTQEKAAIFGRSWQYAGLLEDVPETGSFLTTRAGDVPVVLVRDEDGAVRGFVNVCRHRGAELVLEERGRQQSIQCHYHAWTYGLDGRLRAAPGEKLEQAFDRSCFALVPVRVAGWGPFIFVNPDQETPALEAVLGELPALVEATGLRLSALRRRRRVTYDIAANWKVVVDNYLECYHCPVAHPGFAALIDLDSYRVQEFDYFSVQTGQARDSAPVLQGWVGDGFYAFLWPNFTLNIYPGPGALSINLFQPLGFARTRAVFEYLFVDEVTDDEVEEFARFIEQVQCEDTVLCESVQRGLQSGYLDQGRLMLSRESALRHFQLLVHRALTGTNR